MNDKIKMVLKDQKLSWEKFAKIIDGGDRASLKVKVEGWANKLNQAFNQIGYEVIFRKIDNNSKDSTSL